VYLMDPKVEPRLADPEELSYLDRTSVLSFT
jgi:hypothetical protein